MAYTKNKLNILKYNLELKFMKYKLNKYDISFFVVALIMLIFVLSTAASFKHHNLIPIEPDTFIIFILTALIVLPLGIVLLIFILGLHIFRRKCKWYYYIIHFITLFIYSLVTITGFLIFLALE